MPDFTRETLKLLTRLFSYAGLLLVLSVSRVLALDPAQPAGSYLQTTFTMSEGLPSNVVNAIVQSRSGFLWVGTDAGLARFNGRRFNRVNLRGSISTPQGVVRALALSPDSDLWVGTDAGIIRVPSAILDEFDASRISFYHPGTDLSIGGQLEIESGPRQGTEIELTVPGNIAHVESERQTRGAGQQGRVF
jgi:hypothetical protein